MPARGIKLSIVLPADPAFGKLEFMAADNAARPRHAVFAVQSAPDLSFFANVPLRLKLIEIIPREMEAFFRQINVLDTLPLLAKFAIG